MSSNSIKINNLQAKRKYTKTVFSEYALKFHEAGYKVIPVNGKRPVIQWKDLIDSEQTVESLELMIEEVNRMGYGQEIGIAIMGTDQICALDIDIDDFGLEEMVPMGPIKIRGGKGFKCIYRHNGLKSYNDPIYPIEILAKNRIFVVPPSFHHINEDGTLCFYQMIGEHQGGLEQYPIEELPEITQKDVDALLDYVRSRGIQRKTLIKVGNKDSRSREPSSSDGAVGRNILLYNTVCNELEKRCADLKGGEEDATDEKLFIPLAKWMVEFDKRVFPSNPWYSTDELNERFDFNAFKSAKDMVDRVWYKLKEEVVIGNGSELVVDNLKTHSIEVYKTAELEDVFSKQITENYSNLEKIIPSNKEWEMCIPQTGIIASIIERYNAITPVPIPQYGLAAALCVQSAAASNLIRSKISNDIVQTITNPQIFACVIGPSGKGKNYVKKTLNEFVNYSPQLRDGLASGIASPNGMVETAQSSLRRTVILNLDEITKIFDGGTMSQKNHDFLLEAFTSSDDVISGVRAATKDYRQKGISNLGMVVCGMTTIDGVKTFINAKGMGSGLAGRFLYFVAVKDKDDKTLADRLFINDPSNKSWRADYVDKNKIAGKSLIECMDPVLFNLLEDEIKFQKEWKPSPSLKTEDAEFLRPVDPLILYPASIEAVNCFARQIKKFYEPIELMGRFLGRSAELTAADGVDRSVSNIGLALDNMLARAPELINKLALNLCISDGAFMRSPGEVHVIGEAHFMLAARIYELNCRSIIGLIGNKLMEETHESGIEAGMDYLTKRFNTQTGVCSVNAAIARRQFARLYGKRSHELMTACLRNMYAIYGVAVKFID